MELIESIESINAKLERVFGKFETGQPVWRVVWSEDQFEKRETDRTDEGLQLLQPEVRLLPKYRQWIHAKYVLERLTPVPDVSRKELADKKLSYEPVWVFEDKHGKYLPPRFDAAKFVIDKIMEQAAKMVGVKYKDPESNKEEALEIREKRLEQLHETLFGNETEVGDALRYKEGVVVPRNFES